MATVDDEDVLPTPALERIKEMVAGVEHSVLQLSAAAYDGDATEQAALTQRMAADISALERFAADTLDDLEASAACCRVGLRPATVGWAAYGAALVGLALAAALGVCWGRLGERELSLAR